MGGIDFRHYLLVIFINRILICSYLVEDASEIVRRRDDIVERFLQYDAHLGHSARLAIDMAENYRFPSVKESHGVHRELVTKLTLALDELLVPLVGFRAREIGVTLCGSEEVILAPRDRCSLWCTISLSLELCEQLLG